MSWGPDDAQLLDFAAELVESWDDSTIASVAAGDDITDDEKPACSSPSAVDEVLIETRSPSTEVDKKAAGLARKKKNRGRRKEEILALRTQVGTLERSLEAVKLHQQLKKHAVLWELLAKRELSLRVSAERKNAWLLEALERQVATTDRLVRLFYKMDKTRSRQNFETLTPSELVSGLDQLNKPRARVTDCTETIGTMAIDSNITWRFPGETTQRVEQAVWSLFLMPQWSMGYLTANMEFHVKEPRSVHASFTISSVDGLSFKGAHRVTSTRDETTGELDIQLLARTLPDGHKIDSILEASILDEDTRYRIALDATGTVTVVVTRHSEVVTQGSSPLHRRGVADAVGIHITSELEWLHKETHIVLSSRAERFEEVSTPPQNRVNDLDDLLFVESDMAFVM